MGASGTCGVTGPLRCGGRVHDSVGQRRIRRFPNHVMNGTAYPLAAKERLTALIFALRVRRCRRRTHNA